MKRIDDTAFRGSISLRDEVLVSLESRAEQELKHSESISKAVITLKSALELRKAMLESMLLNAKGGCAGTSSITSIQSKSNLLTTSNRQSSVDKNDATSITTANEILYNPSPRNVPEITIISTTSRLLLMLSRCFMHQGKTKCAQRARRDAETLFFSSRVEL